MTLKLFLMFQRKTLYGEVIQLCRVSFEVESHHGSGDYKEITGVKKRRKRRVRNVSGRGGVVMGGGGELYYELI